MMSLQPGRAASSLQKTLRSEAAHGIFGERLDPQHPRIQGRRSLAAQRTCGSGQIGPLTP